jgi:hypothetical protein
MAGPFFFHWVDATNKVWDEYGSLAVNDEQVVRFDVSQQEGDFAGLSLDIKNPKTGLLSVSRKQWGWLSWDRAWVPLPPQQVGDPPVVDVHVPDYVPLFFGRLVGIPTTINQEVVTIQLMARPADYTAVKAALAETLKVFPYYDPIFINPANIDDPDTVLEARAALWSIDRVTHAIGISDILSGEDGLAAFTQGEIPYDSVEISITQTPLRNVTVDAPITWDQAATGVIDFGTRTFQTYTGASLIRDWPKAGLNLQAGYSVESASIIDHWRTDESFTANYNINWSSIEPKHEPGDTLSTSLSITQPVLLGPGEPFLRTSLTNETQSAVGSASSSNTSLYVLKYQLTTALALRYDVRRGRTEHIKFTLRNNVQYIVTDPGEDETLVLNVPSVDVGLPLPDLTIPIGDVGRANYITTDRGRNSLEYLISLARANLLQRSRAIHIKFACKFDRAIELSCRMNASIDDPRLPGGGAIGKIIEYSFSGDGETGAMEGSVTIGCAIGYGATLSSIAGDPTYIDADYIEDDYQEFENETTVIAGGNVGYSLPLDANADDGLRFPLTKEQVVIHEEWHGSLADQEAAILAAFPTEIEIANAGSPFTFEEKDAQATVSMNALSEVMKEHSIWYDLRLKPPDGKFETIYEIAVTSLEVPQMINLEAI